MQLFTNKITLDIHNVNSQTLLYCKQNDTGRQLLISLSDQLKSYVISDDCTAVFTAKKPDGNIVYNACTITDNIISYVMTPQTTAVPGKLDCEIRLYGADNILITSPRFTLLVEPTVYNDGDIIESATEVTQLTALVSEAAEMIQDANNGAFVPQLTVGTVATLPAGSMATVEISGTGLNPVLNFGIPQGEEGTAEGLIPDTALSLESTRPVQNKVIKAALDEKAVAADLAAVATSGAYADLTGRPTLATVATSGSYNDLSNKPTIPTVPTNVSAFTNDAGYITASAIPGNVSAFTNDAGYLTATTGVPAARKVNNKALSSDIALVLADIGITYGTTDLTPGVSDLATGTIYLVYE